MNDGSQTIIKKMILNFVEYFQMELGSRTQCGSHAVKDLKVEDFPVFKLSMKLVYLRFYRTLVCLL